MKLDVSTFPPRGGDQYNLDKAHHDLFTSILRHLAETDVFGHSGSPSIFVVYAHDNEKEGTANAWCVRLLIEWLGVIRSRTISDKAPLPLWSPRVGSSNSVRNILGNQLCLLPSRDTPSEVGVIHRVDRVIVCGSEVLKRYYQNTFTSSYIDAIITAYDKGQQKSPDLRVLEDSIRKTVQEHSQHKDFHHVLTELAFLRLRNSHSKDNHGIIPVTLHEDLMTWLPICDNCDLVLKLKSLSMTDLHQLFFKLLEQLYIEEHALINQFKCCYDRARKRIQQETTLTEMRCQHIIDWEISRSQKMLRGLESAAFRSHRRDKDWYDSNDLHHTTNQNLQDMHADFKNIFEETTAIKTKLEDIELQGLSMLQVFLPAGLKYNDESIRDNVHKKFWRRAYHTKSVRKRAEQRRRTQERGKVNLVHV